MHNLCWIGSWLSKGECILVVALVVDYLFYPILVFSWIWSEHRRKWKIFQTFLSNLFLFEKKNCWLNECIQSIVTAYSLVCPILGYPCKFIKSIYLNLNSLLNYRLVGIINFHCKVFVIENFDEIEIRRYSSYVYFNPLNLLFKFFYLSSFVAVVLAIVPCPSGRLWDQRPL